MRRRGQLIGKRVTSCMAVPRRMTPCQPNGHFTRDVRLLLPQHKQTRLVLPQQYRRSGARRPAGSKNKDTPADFEVFEVNVTLTGGSCDIDPALLDVMETFLKEHRPAGMFALERGGTVSHLHL